jgi:hypothetical protein
MKVRMTSPAPRFPPAVRWNAVGLIGAWTTGLIGIAAAGICARATLIQFQADGGIWIKGIVLTIVALGTTAAALYAGREHNRPGAIHQARANASWYGAFVPVALLLLYIASIEYPRPYPTPDQAITAGLARITITAPGDNDLNLEFALEGHPLTYTYECHRTRSSWCALLGQLLALAAGPRPHSATIVADGRTLLMLRFDDETFIDWDREHAGRRNAALLLLLAAAIGVGLGLSGIIAYGTWALRLAREETT